jgi:hypothetical protein
MFPAAPAFRFTSYLVVVLKPLLAAALVCASQVLSIGAQSNARGAAQVLDRGAQAFARGSTR